MVTSIGKEIKGFALATPQEHLLVGSSPTFLLDFQLQDNPVVPNGFYIPEGIQFYGFSFNDIREARLRERYFASQKSWVMGLGPHLLAFSYPDLDPSTYMTLEDPRILGLIHESTKQLIPLPTGNWEKGLRMVMDSYTKRDPYVNIRWRLSK